MFETFNCVGMRSRRQCWRRRRGSDSRGSGRRGPPHAAKRADDAVSGLLRPSSRAGYGVGHPVSSHPPLTQSLRSSGAAPQEPQNVRVQGFWRRGHKKDTMDAQPTEKRVLSSLKCRVYAQHSSRTTYCYNRCREIQLRHAWVDVANEKYANFREKLCVSDVCSSVARNLAFWSWTKTFAHTQH